MAIPVNIHDLINSKIVESSRIEFKGDWNPEPILHTICAFANDIDNLGGGYIIIGIDEKDGVPILPPRGIEKERLDGIQKKLLGYCHFIEPLYQPVVEPVFYQNRYILVVWVAGGFGRPYKAPKNFYIDKNKPNPNIKCYYIRKFSSTVIASPSEEKDLFYISSDIPFDDRPNLASDISDLDLGLMREHLKEIGSELYEQSLHADVLEIAQDLQIVAGPPEHLKPRNVGILMFSERPEKYFRYARIEIVDIPDPTGSGMSEKTFTGPIQRQLKDALSYLKNYVIKETVLKSSDKAEATRINNYPFAAIEEILSNAVYHRSYQINEPITVRITPTAIEVTSFPGFDRSISDDNIKNYQIRSRWYRNRRIGDFLKELKLIEGRNTGFPTVLKALKENGSSYPIFEMNPERDYLSVTLPIHPYFLPTRKSPDKNAQYIQTILNKLQESPMMLSELALAMGYKSITKKLSDTVEYLVTTGKLVRIPYSNSQNKLALPNNSIKSFS